MGKYNYKQLHNWGMLKEKESIPMNGQFGCMDCLQLVNVGDWVEIEWILYEDVTVTLKTKTKRMLEHGKYKKTIEKAREQNRIVNCSAMQSVDTGVQKGYIGIQM